MRTLSLYPYKILILGPLGIAFLSEDIFQFEDTGQNEWLPGAGGRNGKGK